MEPTTEQIVTKILTEREILMPNRRRVRGRSKMMSAKFLSTNPIYDLGSFIKNYKPEPSRFGSKYVFVR